MLLAPPMKLTSWPLSPLLFFFLLLLRPGKPFYLPGTYPRWYADRSLLSVKVNSLTSVHTELPFSYYSLPFCLPPGGVRPSAESLGELLMRDRVENSPYQFKMHSNEAGVFLCSVGPLSAHQAEALTQRIDESYRVNLILDGLPVIQYVNRDNSALHEIGYPLGLRSGDVHYVFNHLKFRVLIHESRIADHLHTIVGFEVTPCSHQHELPEADKMKIYDKLPDKIKCDPAAPSMEVKEGDVIVFSYDVAFVQSEIKWPSRWDAYLDMSGSRLHWFSIMNSFMVIALLAGIVLTILFRTVRRDLAQCENDLGRESTRQEDVAGWKVISGDVFRAPTNPDILCIMVGDGVQILAMGVFTILFSAIGFMSPASRGALINGMLFLYVALGFTGGYVSAKLWRTINNGRFRGWVLVSLKVAFLFTGITMLDLILLNFLLWGSNSTGALPFSTFGTLLFLWSCVSTPLTLIGSYFGGKSTPISYPTKTGQILREIPPQNYPSWGLVLGGGMLSFAALFIELFFIMSSLWHGRMYYFFGFLFMGLVMLLVVCAEVSMVITYMLLCAEDWRWWWRSFFSSGSVAIYIFLYSVFYLLFGLHSLSGKVSALLYVGYSLLMVFAVFLATGAVGFLSSFWFVHYLFSSVKLD